MALQFGSQEVTARSVGVVARLTLVNHLTRSPFFWSVGQLNFCLLTSSRQGIRSQVLVYTMYQHQLTPWCSKIQKKREHLLPSECVVVKLPVVPSTSALLYDHNSDPSALDFNDFNGYTRYGSGWSSFKVARARRSCSSRFGSLKEKGGCMPCSWAACEVAPRVWSFLGFLLVSGNMSQQIKSVNSKNSSKRVVEC